MKRSVLVAVSWLAAAAMVSAAGPPPRAVPDPPVVDGYLQLDFYSLSNFPFAEPDVDHSPEARAPLPDCLDRIPAAVRRWTGHEVALTGYMLPVKLDEHGNATQLLLMANLMLCCYGTVPKTNDWVVVLVPAGTPVVQDVPIAFRGHFTVGAVYQDRYLTGVYQLDAKGPGRRTE